ncbi:MAG: hypothetical protein ACLGJC_09625 [Alphaproteobacteria bacterium]
MPAIRISVPDDIDLGRQAIAAEATKPRRKRRMKTKAEWTKFVAKKHGPAAVTEALRKASASRKVANDSRRRCWSRISKIIQADAEEARALDIKLDKQAGVKVSGAAADKGTAPTRKRLQTDNCLLMLTKGQITQDMYNATCEIRAAYYFIVRGMDARIATYGETFGAGKDDYESVYAVMVQEHYLDWIDAMAERAKANARAKRGGNRWKTWLPMAVIIDGITCSDIAHQRGMKTQTVAEYLRDALDLFNDVRFGRIKRDRRMAA